MEILLWFEWFSHSYHDTWQLVLFSTYVKRVSKLEIVSFYLDGRVEICNCSAGSSTRLRQGGTGSFLASASSFSLLCAALIAESLTDWIGWQQVVWRLRSSEGIKSFAQHDRDSTRRSALRT